MSNVEFLERIGRDFLDRAATQRLYEKIARQAAQASRIKTIARAYSGLYEAQRTCNLGLLHAWKEGLLDRRWAEARQKINRPQDFLHYFIQSKATGDIKIGRTNRMTERFNALLCASPRGLELVACVPGGPECEADFHEEFAAGRLNGEWFELHGALINYLRWIGSTVWTPFREAA